MAAARLLRLVGAGALVSLALAAPVAAKGVDKSEANAKAAKTELARWPLPAADGRVLAYDVVSERRRVRASGETGLRSTSVVEIRPGPPRDDGYEQHWTSRDGRLVFEGERSADQRALLEAAGRLFGELPLRVRLDADGAAQGVEDVEAEFVPRFRELMDVALAAAGTDSPQARQVVDALSRPEVVEAMLLQVPAAYYFPGAGGVPFSEGIEYAENAPNPFGGDPFPMLGRIAAARGAAADEVELTWTLAIDPVKGAPILWDAVASLLGPDAVDAVRDELPDQIHVETVTRYRIDAATGVIRWMESVETKRVLDNEDVNRTTMTLRAAPATTDDAGGGAPQGFMVPVRR